MPKDDGRGRGQKNVKKTARVVHVKKGGKIAMSGIYENYNNSEEEGGGAKSSGNKEDNTEMVMARAKSGGEKKDKSEEIGGAKSSKTEKNNSEETREDANSGGKKGKMDIADLQVKIVPSLLPAFLLHLNDDSASHETCPEYNPFFTARVNMRKCVKKEKLVSMRENGLVHQLVTGRAVLTGDFLMVLSSYEVVSDTTEPVSDTTEGDILLYLASTSRAHQKKIRCIPATPECLLQGIQWLNGLPRSNDDSEDMKKTLLNTLLSVGEAKCMDDSTVQIISNTSDDTRFDINSEDTWQAYLSLLFVNQMCRLHPPNATTEKMITFIKEREWNSKCCWGDSKEQFLEAIEGMKDDMVKWTQLRRFICFNLAWSSGLVLLPVDCLHRTATADSALMGIPPPEAGEDLKTEVEHYWSRISPANGGLGPDGNGEAAVLLHLWHPRQIDDAFLEQMKNVTAQRQKFGEHSTFRF